MFNLKLLKSKLVERGVSVLDICNELGICETTFYRKLSRDGDFSRFEIKKIVEILNLTPTERDAIFFA